MSKVLEFYWYTCVSMLFAECQTASVCPSKVQSLDDFVPDERLDKSFLEDSLPVKTKVPQTTASAAVVDSDRWWCLFYFWSLDAIGHLCSDIYTWNEIHSKYSRVVAVAATVVLVVWQGILSDGYSVDSITVYSFQIEYMYWIVCLLSLSLRQTFRGCLAFVLLLMEITLLLCVYSAKPYF